MHPTVQELNEYYTAIETWRTAAKEWTDAAIEAVEDEVAIGSNPPPPPPPPPGTSYGE